MFGLIAKRHDSHYRQAMRELQPFATETNSLWLSGYYRGVNVLVPFAPKPAYAQQQRRRDY